MLAEIRFYSLAEQKDFILTINGGVVTLRLASQKPHEAKPIVWQEKMELLAKINAALPKGGEYGGR
jgi:hypothetical protein